jgi:hypothetical protein
MKPEREQLIAAMRQALGDMGAFSRGVVGVGLREYQLAPLRAVLDAIQMRAGGTYVVEFARQAGKDEAVAQLLAYLLLRYKNVGGKVVMAAPTAGQVAISRQRLRERLDNRFTAGLWRVQGAYSLALGKASATFLTAQPSANVRGHTASLLLCVNEAQDVDREVFEARLAPMTASTNAPHLFMGTPWRSDSLLAWARQQAVNEEQAEGRPHVFLVDWQQVAAEVGYYRQHVERRAAQLGWQHPFIQTEYCLKELDGSGGMFDAHRRAQMQGEHQRQHQPATPLPSGGAGGGFEPRFAYPHPTSPAGGGGNQSPAFAYALLLDVAGEAEAEEWEIRAANPRKDSTALTVVAVDSSGALPVYRVLDRREWLGTKHTALYDTLLDLAENVWHAAAVVVDATGIGAGLASFLQAKLGKRLRPFLFNATSKSRLGWDFLALVESGRFKDYADDHQPDTRRFWQQVAACQFEVLPGPGKLMRWRVPDPAVHDDLLISATLVAALDSFDFRPRVARTREY